MENSGILTNILTDHTTQFRFDPIMNVTKSGTGAVNLATRNTSGEDIWSADLANPINILLQPHLLSLEQVQAFLGWFRGDQNFHPVHLN